MKIPIENIYYLLCYAWNKLDEKDQLKISLEDTTQLVDLFAKVLINGCKILLKQGFERNYIEETIEVAGVKGKLEFSPTVKTGFFLKQKTICTIDEYSSDILTNRILVSTLYLILKIKEVDKELRAQVRELTRKFSGITPFELNHRHFTMVRLHRNNRLYGFLMNVCQTIFENSLPTEETGRWLFKDFLREESKMNRLFESFLFNFYRIEYPNWKVRKEHIYWRFSAFTEGNINFLPRMETDISIYTKSEKIIIDAKYYREALTSQFETKKLQSNNLYQIFSYLINQRDNSPLTENARGILIYPATDVEINLEYQFENHQIDIKTVDLNVKWMLIEKRLKEIVIS